MGTYVLNAQEGDFLRVLPDADSSIAGEYCQVIERVLNHRTGQVYYEVYQPEDEVNFYLVMASEVEEVENVNEGYAALFMKGEWDL